MLQPTLIVLGVVARKAHQDGVRTASATACTEVIYVVGKEHDVLV